ncbi:hypothetical protein D3C87_1295550 [compost metagenome]
MAAVARQIAAVVDLARAQMHKGQAVARSALEVPLVAAPHQSHGASGQHHVVHAHRLEVRRLFQHTALDLAGRQPVGTRHLGREHTVARHRGAQAALVDELVLRQVDDIVQAEHGGAQRDDEMEWQAGHAQQVVHVQPHALEVGAQAQVEQVLDQRGKQNDDAGHQRQRVDQ